MPPDYWIQVGQNNAQSITWWRTTALLSPACCVANPPSQLIRACHLNRTHTRDLQQASLDGKLPQFHGAVGRLVMWI